MPPSKAHANGRAQREPNGHRAKATPKPHKELTEEDKARFREWLEQPGEPFTVHVEAPSRKRKRRADGDAKLEEGLLAKNLQVLYEVRPRDKWESLRPYRKFTVGSESIMIGQCVLVKHDEATQDMRMDSEAQWKAQVLDIRALDPEHVYIRVAWLNRPEDTEKGREPHHGKHELIVTNQMDVIDAMAVNGSLDVVPLDDDQHDDGIHVDDQYFWRQTYNVLTGKYSRLRDICKDKTPANPDEMIIQCSSGKCREWLHVKCLAEEALREHEAGARYGTVRPKDEENERRDATPVANAQNREDTVSVEVYVKADPTGADHTPAVRSEIVVLPETGEPYARDLLCLICASPIEDDT